MSLVHSNWVCVGDLALRRRKVENDGPVELRVASNNAASTGGRHALELSDFLAKIKEYDMLEIRLTNPARYPAAVDTNVLPRIIRQNGRDDVALVAQVTRICYFAKVTQITCNCLDEVNHDFYTMELGFSQNPEPYASVRLSARLGAIEDFGAPAPDMAEAFARYFAKMHPDIAPPR